MLDYQTWSNICSFTDKKEQVYTWFVPTCYHYHCHHHTTFFYPYVFCALVSFTSLLVSKQELSLSLQNSYITSDNGRSRLAVIGGNERQCAAAVHKE
jgi:hypothetical protein